MKSKTIPNYLLTSHDFGGLLINSVVYFVEIGEEGLTFNNGILKDMYYHDKRIIITASDRVLLEVNPIPKWYDLNNNTWFRTAININEKFKEKYGWDFGKYISNATACAGIQHSAVLTVYRNIVNNFTQEMNTIGNQRIKELNAEKARIEQEITFYRTWFGK